MGPYAGVDNNLTLCPLQHIYNGQPYTRLNLNPNARVGFIPQSGTKNLTTDVFTCDLSNSLSACANKRAASYISAVSV